MCYEEDIRVCVGMADRDGYLSPEDEREVGRGREVRIRTRDIPNLTASGPGSKIVVYAVKLIGDDNGRRDAGPIIRDGGRYRYNRLDANGKVIGYSLQYLGNAD